MHKEFSYIQNHPLIEIVLIGPKERIKMLALLDSGADYSLFSLEVAERLGIQKENGTKVGLQGVVGEPFLGYLHRVPIQVEDMVFNCTIVFSKVKTTLLGRDNFFLPFLVTFNEKQQKVSLKELNDGNKIFN
jgi:hypothetical protein